MVGSKASFWVGLVKLFRNCISGVSFVMFDLGQERLQPVPGQQEGSISEAGSHVTTCQQRNELKLRRK